MARRFHRTSRATDLFFFSSSILLSKRGAKVIRPVPPRDLLEPAIEPRVAPVAHALPLARVVVAARVVVVVRGAPPGRRRRRADAISRQTFPGVARLRPGDAHGRVQRAAAGGDLAAERRDDVVPLRVRDGVEQTRGAPRRERAARRLSTRRIPRCTPSSFWAGRKSGWS